MNEAEFIRLLDAKDKLKPMLRYRKDGRWIVVYDDSDAETRRILFGIRDYIQTHSKKMTRIHMDK